MTKEKISVISDEHQSWLSALVFYKDELNVLRERLTEIASKNTSKELLAHVEHYENSITLQQENIDILKHDINHNLTEIAKQLQTNKAGYVDNDLHKLHSEQKDRFEATEKVIGELRHDFNRFAVRWM